MKRILPLQASMKILSHFSAIANRVINVNSNNFLFTKLFQSSFLQESSMKISFHFLVFSEILKYFVKGRIISESGEMAD